MNPDKLKEIEALETEMRAIQERLVKLRKEAVNNEVIENKYVFKTAEGATVTLDQLFAGKSELIVIHNMGKRCLYCTLWADGFNGFVPHLENRAGFVVISPDEPEVQRVIATDRGWKFRLVSAAGTSFFQDMNMWHEGGAMPGVSTFRKDETGRIVRVAFSYFGPGDIYNSIWHLYDLLPEGAGDWEPKYKYL